MNYNSLSVWCFGGPAHYHGASIPAARIVQAYRLSHGDAGSGSGTAVPDFLLAAWMEVIGSVLLIVGLFTRLVAFLLSGEMAVAYFIAHAQQSFYPIVNQGEAANSCSALSFSTLSLPAQALGASTRERDSRQSPPTESRGKGDCPLLHDNRPPGFQSELLILRTMSTPVGARQALAHADLAAKQLSAWQSDVA